MALPALIPILAPLLGSVLDKVLPDPEAAAKAKAEVLSALGAIDQAQNDLNKIDAQSGSLYKGGWRPAAGWVCVAALAYQFLARPLLPWGFAVAGIAVPPLPGLDEMLWELMFALLGMGGLRTFEKHRGVAG